MVGQTLGRTILQKLNKDKFKKNAWISNLRFTGTKYLQKWFVAVSLMFNGYC